MSAFGRQGLGRLTAVLVVLLLAGCQSVPFEADEVPGIDRVVTRYRGEKEIHRLSQTWGVEPSADGSDVVILSDRASRIGYYFWINLGIDPPAGSSVRIEYVDKENLPPTVRTYALARNPGGLFGEIVVGLTGPDARTPKWHPIAWRVSIISPEGKTLASKRSFLWGAPRERAP